MIELANLEALLSDTEKTIQFFRNPDGAIQMNLIRP
jgi:hypothetical protein